MHAKGSGAFGTLRVTRDITRYTKAEIFSQVRGADVNRHNNRGQTPLAGAVFKNETTIIELLLGADADPLAGSPSALETARFFSKEQLTRQLLQHLPAER
jgi:ankyrin repeat protein